MPTEKHEKKTKKQFDSQNNIINLKPVFITKFNNSNVLSFDSVFLYIFLLFEICVVVLILYFFFQNEIIFLYYNVFKDKTFSDEDKTIYNEYMYNMKIILSSPKYCSKITNNWYPLYSDYKSKNNFMLALNNNKIFFENEADCKGFLQPNT